MLLKTISVHAVRLLAIGVVAGLVAYQSAGAAPAAAKPAPAPSEVPVAVVADATAAQAALDKAAASRQGLVADLTLGHEGKLVRSKSAAPLAPGRYRLHALVAITAKGEPLGEGVAVRLAAGEKQKVLDPGGWIPEQGKLAPVLMDFVVDKPGSIPVTAEWIVQGDIPQRQNVINKLSLRAGRCRAAGRRCGSRR